MTQICFPDPIVRSYPESGFQTRSAAKSFKRVTQGYEDPSMRRSALHKHSTFVPVHLQQRGTFASRSPSPAVKGRSGVRRLPKGTAGPGSSLLSQRARCSWHEVGRDGTITSSLLF